MGCSRQPKNLRMMQLLKVLESDLERSGPKSRGKQPRVEVKCHKEELSVQGKCNNIYN